MQGAPRVGDQVSGRKQAADPGRHIGHRALEGHEGGALMGSRNGRGDREGGAGAGRAQGHEEGKQQVDGQADRHGEAEQGDQRQQQAGEQYGALGAALVYPAAAQAHGSHAGEAAAQIEGGDLLPRETEVELEVVRKVRDQQEVAEHLQAEDAQGPLTERRAQQLAQPLALRGSGHRQ